MSVHRLRPLVAVVQVLALMTLAPPRDLIAQTPPYSEEEVRFTNGAVTLAGTLTLPSVRQLHPAMILISGSGPQDRDETVPGVPGYVPFRWIADHLGRRGFAVLRYDDRGTAKSTGDHSVATSLDLASDAEAALRYVLSRRDVDSSRIGIMGHSEGGLIAAMVAARNRRVAFVISMAGPGVRGYEVFVVQGQRSLRAEGLEESQIAQFSMTQRMILDLIVAGNWAALESRLYEQILASLRALPPERRRQIGDLEAVARRDTGRVLVFYRGWVRFFLTHDPGQDWGRVKSPVLALFGVLDVQVDWKQNSPAMEAALARAGNHDVTVVTFSRANHFFQEAVTGSIREYATLPKAFVPAFLPTITEWLADRFAANRGSATTPDRHFDVR